MRLKYVKRRHMYKETYTSYWVRDCTLYIIYIYKYATTSSPQIMTETAPFPPGSHRTRHQRYVRAGAPAVPRHKLPRYVVLSYDPPGRGHLIPGGRGDGEVWAWWWSGGMAVSWCFLYFFFLGGYFSRVFDVDFLGGGCLGGLQVVFFFSLWRINRHIYRMP